MSDTIIGSASERLRQEALWRPDAERLGRNLADAAYSQSKALEPSVQEMAAQMAARRERLLASLRVEHPLPPEAEARYFAHFQIPFDEAILDAFRRRWAELAGREGGTAS